jgi:hypothetical protein
MRRMLTIGFALVVAVTFAGNADAATRFWQLQNGVLADGRTVVGSFGYDDVANQITSWNLRVGGAPGFLPFTWVPGNAVAQSFGQGIVGGFVYTFEFHANAGAGNAERVLDLSVALALDGTVPSQALYLVDPATGFHYSYDRRPAIGDRNLTGGSLALVPFPPPVGVVDAIEFFHAGFGHYFLSADPVEINALDTGYFAGWARTGQSFQAYATGSSGGPSNNPVCRYYGLPSAGIDSHFYSASAVECWEVNEYYGTEWQVESDNVFQIDLPDTSTGACPGGTIAVYRVFNQKQDANHRYTTSAAIRAAMEAQGWKREGYGPDATIMCAIAP